MKATLYVYNKPGVSSEGTLTAQARGDTLRRALSNLADVPAVREAPRDCRMTVEVTPDVH